MCLKILDPPRPGIKHSIKISNFKIFVFSLTDAFPLVFLLFSFLCVSYNFLCPWHPQSNISCNIEKKLCFPTGIWSLLPIFNYSLTSTAYSTPLVGDFGNISFGFVRQQITAKQQLCAKPPARCWGKFKAGSESLNHNSDLPGELQCAGEGGLCVRSPWRGRPGSHRMRVSRVGNRESGVGAQELRGNIRASWGEKRNN